MPIFMSFKDSKDQRLMTGSVMTAGYAGWIKVDACIADGKDLEVTVKRRPDSDSLGLFRLSMKNAKAATVTIDFVRPIPALSVTLTNAEIISFTQGTADRTSSDPLRNRLMEVLRLSYDDIRDSKKPTSKDPKSARNDLIYEINRRLDTALSYFTHEGM
jgi:type VI protein secretion system component Hcp